MASYEAESTEDQATKIKFRFCKNCANLLYPGEDREDGGLIFECRHCNESERADNSCVFRNELSNAVGETAGITQDVGSDPTVCSDSDIPPMCTMCGQEIFCEECGLPQEDGYLCLEVNENDKSTPKNDSPQPQTAQEKLAESLESLRMKGGATQGSGR
ncbi:MAG: hypothetical protein Q9159_001363 [Coniocarpon cinnabarinum]